MRMKEELKKEDEPILKTLPYIFYDDEEEEEDFENNEKLLVQLKFWEAAFALRPKKDQAEEDEQSSEGEDEYLYTSYNVNIHEKMRKVAQQKNPRDQDEECKGGEFARAHLADPLQKKEAVRKEQILAAKEEEEKKEPEIPLYESRTVELEKKYNMENYYEMYWVVTQMCLLLEKRVSDEENEDEGVLEDDWLEDDDREENDRMALR